MEEGVPAVIAQLVTIPGIRSRTARVIVTEPAAAAPGSQRAVEGQAEDHPASSRQPLTAASRNHSGSLTMNEIRRMHAVFAHPTHPACSARSKARTTRCLRSG